MRTKSTNNYRWTRDLPEDKDPLYLTKALLIVATCMVMIGFLLSLTACSSSKDKEISRKYTVRLSNYLGSNHYQCDSVIWITDSHFKLKNNEDNIPFVDIFIPEQVVVRISLNNQ